MTNLAIVLPHTSEGKPSLVRVGTSVFPGVIIEKSDANLQQSDQ